MLIIEPIKQYKKQGTIVEKIKYRKSQLLKQIKCCERRLEFWKKWISAIQKPDSNDVVETVKYGSKERQYKCAKYQLEDVIMKNKGGINQLNYVLYLFEKTE